MGSGSDGQRERGRRVSPKVRVPVIGSEVADSRWEPATF
jgi:hypothetical protein